MPYIAPEQRKQLDNAIENLVIEIVKLTDETGKLMVAGPGIYNYIFSSILAVPYGYKTTYSKINEAIGILECAKLELYRRVAAPYEDVKLRANGDVYPTMGIAIESSH